MILEVDESFSFERKAVLDASNPKVEAWEALCGTTNRHCPTHPQTPSGYQ